MKNKNDLSLIRNNQNCSFMIKNRRSILNDQKSNLIVLFNVALLLFYFSMNLKAQELKEAINKASVIYVTPITGQYYYIVYLHPYTIDDEASIPVYEKNKDFRVDDILKITTTSNPQVYLFARVIGKIPDEFIDKINQSVMDSCKNLFGADKVMFWPEGKFMDEKWGGYDEKAVECDFYVTQEFMVTTQFQPFKDNMLFPNSENLIGFELEPLEDTQQKVLEMELFPNYIKLGFFQKTKPGKNGSKIAMVTKMNLFNESKAVSVAKPEAEFTTESTDNIKIWEEFDKVSNDISIQNQKWFEENIQNAINEFIKEIKENLSE